MNGGGRKLHRSLNNNMPSPILNASEEPFTSFIPQTELSPRDTEIIKDILVWEVHNHFEPTLICLLCAHNDLPEEKWKMKTHILPTGEVVMTCGCSQYVGWAPIPDTTPPVMMHFNVIGKKKIPLSQSEAALLSAWKYVMQRYHWAEGLICSDCFAQQVELGGVDCSVHGATIPGKSITYVCNCSERTWKGIQK